MVGSGTLPSDWYVLYPMENHTPSQEISPHCLLSFLRLTGNSIGRDTNSPILARSFAPSQISGVRTEPNVSLSSSSSVLLQSGIYWELKKVWCCVLTPHTTIHKTVLSNFVTRVIEFWTRWNIICGSKHMANIGEDLYLVKVFTRPPSATALERCSSIDFSTVLRFKLRIVSPEPLQFSCIRLGR
jgi:hypothetical protein